MGTLARSFWLDNTVLRPWAAESSKKTLAVVQAVAEGEEIKREALAANGFVDRFVMVLG
jgi:hypothetical protein